jgi:integrin alpha FG-GAP repeat containing protein 1
MGFLSVEGRTDGIHMQAYINNYEIENYFLKGIAMVNAEEFQSVSGASFSIQKTGFYGEVSTAERQQTAHCTAGRLCAPWVHFGLGKINHYVENFKLSVPRTQNWENTWSPIIPNSQLMVFAPAGTQSNWKISIFINPTSAMWFIFISTCVVLVAILLVILWLHYKEKNNDVEFIIPLESKI